MISLVRASLSNLTLAIAGTIVMSPDVTDALDKLFMARVPEAWTKVSQLDAPNTGVWFTNIVQRAEQLTGWLQGGRPSCFWLTGFFNPQGFLTANRQEVCRKHNKDGWALDDVVNSTEVLRQEREEVRKGPDEGSSVRRIGFLHTTTHTLATQSAPAPKERQPRSFFKSYQRQDPALPSSHDDNVNVETTRVRPPRSASGLSHCSRGRTLLAVCV